SRTAIDGTPVAEYLDGNRLTVLSSIWQPLVTPVAVQAGTRAALPVLWARGTGRVKVTTFDVSDPTTPQVVQTTVLDGGYDASRMVNGKLYLGLQSDLFPGLAASGGPVALARSGSGSGSGSRARAGSGTGTGTGTASQSGPTALANAPIERILPGFTATV